MCTKCGYNTATRQRTGAGRKVAPGRPAAARPEGVAGWFKTIYPYLALVVILMGVLALLSRSIPELKLAYIAFALLFGLVVQIWLLVVAFKDSIMKGILCMCIGIYALYYLLKECESTPLKVAYAVSALLWGGAYLMMGD